MPHPLLSSSEGWETTNPASRIHCLNYAKFCIFVKWIDHQGPIELRGSSLEDLSRFPAVARRKAGFQLFQVQDGDDPEGWKPMADIGPGVMEIRVREKDGAFRVSYVASLAKAVYVLHCFQKKTRKTSDADKELAKRRHKELVRETGK